MFHQYTQITDVVPEVVEAAVADVGRESMASVIWSDHPAVQLGGYGVPSGPLFKVTVEDDGRTTVRSPPLADPKAQASGTGL
jgi:hypothetical protein